MPQSTLNAQAIAQLELDKYISEQAIAVLCPQEDLLDKAFDELTPSEWEQLKQYQPEIESDRVKLTIQQKSTFVRQNYQKT